MINLLLYSFKPPIHRQMNTTRVALLSCLLILNVHCFAQIRFQKGYFINTSGKKIECLIKNVDWEKNPSKFEYKSSENAEVLTATIDDVTEFAVPNEIRFVRQSVLIDRSNRDLNGISSTQQPDFQKETIFLRVVVEGKASLFRVRDSKNEKYFFSSQSSKVEQLIYKKYLLPGGDIGANNTFRQQLRNALQCKEIEVRDLKSLSYRRRELQKVFVTYNQCENADFVNWEATKDSMRSFVLTIRPGINYGRAKMRSAPIASSNVDFDNQLTFRIGLEGDFTLPFHNRKWSLFAEPTYQYYKPASVSEPQRFTLTYQSLEIPIGIRHKFYMNDQSNIFINLGATIDLPFKSKVDVPSGIDLDMKPSSNFFAGAGYKFLDRFSFEIRYSTPSTIIQYTVMDVNYKKLSFVLGYSIWRPHR